MNRLLDIFVVILPATVAAARIESLSPDKSLNWAGIRKKIFSNIDFFSSPVLSDKTESLPELFSHILQFYLVFLC